MDLTDTSSSTPAALESYNQERRDRQGVGDGKIRKRAGVEGNGIEIQDDLSWLGGSDMGSGICDHCYHQNLPIHLNLKTEISIPKLSFRLYSRTPKLTTTIAPCPALTSS